MKEVVVGVLVVIVVVVFESLWFELDVVLFMVMIVMADDVEAMRGVAIVVVLLKPNELLFAGKVELNTTIKFVWHWTINTTQLFKRT